MSPDGYGLILSVEHGDRRVPPEYAELFRGQEALLASHRGYDPGARELAEQLQRASGAPLFVTGVTRLLVDCNRSPGHPRLHAPFVRTLPAAERRRLVERYHRPHRQAVEQAVAAALTAGPVLHLSVHSFTPELNGEVRRADIGLLYDPARPAEAALAGRWQAALRQCRPDWRVRRNSPYRGAADSLVTALRRRWSDGRYLGLELEVNQRLPLTGGAAWSEAKAALAAVLTAEVRR